MGRLHQVDCGVVNMGATSSSCRLDLERTLDMISYCDKRDIEEGALFTVISTSPCMVGEGENMREDILAGIV